MLYQHKKTRFKIFSKEKTLLKAWDPVNQRIKRNHSGYFEINRNIDQIEAIIQKVVRDANFNSIEPFASYIKSELNIEFQKEGDDKIIIRKFFEVFDDFIETSMTLKSFNTVRSYKSTLARIKDYESKKKRKITFDSIDNEFYEKFTKYLISECNLLNNSIGKHIKILKTFLNYVTEKGINQKLAYKKFKVLTEQVDIVNLTEKELLHLNSLELKSDRLKNVRDIFCLACFTGLRFSDLHKVKSETIKEGMLYLKTEKTRDILSIPLNDYALEIIDRHSIDGKIQLPSIITNQKMNEYLKELGKLANLNDLIEQHRYSGNFKKTTTTEKHKLISTHTARRTFVTLSLEKGFRPEVVMEMTGHKNYATFKRYIKITNKVKKEEMKRLWGKSTLQSTK